MKKVSIIIPVYNEEKTIIQILKKIDLIFDNSSFSLIKNKLENIIK